MLDEKIAISFLMILRLYLNDIAVENKKDVAKTETLVFI